MRYEIFIAGESTNHVISQLIRWRRMRWVGRVARMKEVRKAPDFYF
jgi:hypothetical protein